MMELIEANWPLLLVALLIGIAVAWFVFVANRKTTVTTERRDVLDEGAERASRNEALIHGRDAAPPPAGAQPVPPVPPTGLAGVGTAIAAAVEDQEAKAGRAHPVSDDGDDLTRIKGVGPKLAGMLNDNGVTRFDQIANWSDQEATEMDARLGRFQGRMERDNWREQARLLAAGDKAAYEERFGKQ